MANEIPPVERLRWPILVVLDGLGDDEVLDLEDRVVQRLELSEDARAAVDQETGRALITQRLMQAIEALYQADAVEPDEDGGSIRITDVGRRLTEVQVRELPAAPGAGVATPEIALPDKQRASVSDWIFAILDGLGG